MTTLELLRQQAKELADQIDAADEQRLRRISAVIGKAAVERSDLKHPIISEALDYLGVSASANPELRARVQKAAEELDEDYFRLQETAEGDDTAESQLLEAFSKARAAAAVAAALGGNIRQAASETAYEALAATGDAPYLTDIARSV